MTGRSAALAVVVVLAWCPAYEAQSLEWWKSREVQKHLDLSPQQVRTIEALFRQNLDGRRRLKHAIDGAEVEMERAIAAADEPAGLAAIERYVALHERQNKARLTLLVRIAAVLTPAQRRRLSDLRNGKR
jgi:Spy/CpxP family protein refolding chaperone